MGTGRPPKVLMYTDSRKAQRNSYAHHRAHMLFSKISPDQTRKPLSSGKDAEGVETDLTSLAQRIRAGIVGFAPAGTMSPV